MPRAVTASLAIAKKTGLCKVVGPSIGSDASVYKSLLPNTILCQRCLLLNANLGYGHSLASAHRSWSKSVQSKLLPTCWTRLRSSIPFMTGWSRILQLNRQAHALHLLCISNSDHLPDAFFSSQHLSKEACVKGHYRTQPDICIAQPLHCVDRWSRG